MSHEWLTASTPEVPRRGRTVGSAFGMSLAAHVVFLLLLIVCLTVQQAPVDTKAPPVKLNLVYMPVPGLGGGGGGDRAEASAKTIEVPQHELPKPVDINVTPVMPKPPTPELPVIDIPVQTNAADVLRYAGVSTSPSMTPGGGGPGTRGAGPGDDDGLGPGKRGGTGDGPRQPGGNVTTPTLVRSVDPKYTTGALTAKISGSVELEVIVLANGTVGPVKVIKSLDKVYGLDQEAINAARQWVFLPSTQDGKPVDVVVRFILDFHVR